MAIVAEGETSAACAPAGVDLNLKDAKWALALEACLKGLISAFVCNDHQDERILLEILSDIKSQHRGRAFHRPVIIISLFKVSLVICCPPSPSSRSSDSFLVARCLLRPERLQVGHGCRDLPERSGRFLRLPQSSRRTTSA